MRGNWDPEEKGLAKAAQLGSSIGRRWQSQEVPGIGLKSTSSSSKTLSFRSDQDSRVGVSGCRPVRDWPMELFAWSLFLVHFCVFFLSLEAVGTKESSRNKGDISLFTPHVPLAPLGLVLKGRTIFSCYCQLYWTLSFSFIFSYFLPNNCLCFWGRVLRSFPSHLTCSHRKGLCTRRSPDGWHG